MIGERFCSDMEGPNWERKSAMNTAWIVTGFWFFCFGAQRFLRGFPHPQQAYRIASLFALAGAVVWQQDSICGIKQQNRKFGHFGGLL